MELEQLSAGASGDGEESGERGGSDIHLVDVVTVTSPVRHQTECRLEDMAGSSPRVTESLLRLAGSPGDLSEYELADSTTELDLFPQIPIVGSETAMAALAPQPRPEGTVSQSHTSPEGFLDDSLYQPHCGRRPLHPPSQPKDDLPKVAILRTRCGSQPNGLAQGWVEASDSRTDLRTKELTDRSKSHPNGLTRILIDKSGSLPNGLTRAMVTRSKSQPSGFTRPHSIGETGVKDSKDHSPAGRDRSPGCPDRTPRNGYVCNFLEMQDSCQSIDGLLEESVKQLNRITEDLLGDTVL